MLLIIYFQIVYSRACYYLVHCCEYATYGIDDVDIYDNTDIVLDCCSGLERGNSKDCIVQMTAVFIIKLFFSSPEHEVLMVSYCGQWLSVVRRRASCVVRRASSVVRQHLMFTL